MRNKFVYNPGLYDSDIFDKLKEIIIDKLWVDDEEITLNASLVNDLGCDELDVVELVMEIEKKFGIRIPDEDFDNMYEKEITVSHCVKLIKKLKSEL